jgi:hypothetical protein
MHARRSRRPSALLAPAAALLLLAFTAACDDDDDPGAPAPTAQLRFFHTAPGTGAVTFRVDGAALASNVELAAAPSGYVTVNAGARALAVRTAAGTTDLAAETATLKADMPHTVILSKDGTGVDLVVLADTNTAPAAGKAKLRLVHAAPSAAAAVDVYVTAPGADLAAATPTATNVAYEAASKYLELAAGTYQIRFTATGTKTVALDAGEVTLTAGQIRTTAALDAAAGGTPLRAVVIQDKNP